MRSAVIHILSSKKFLILGIFCVCAFGCAFYTNAFPYMMGIKVLNGNCWGYDDGPTYSPEFGTWSALEYEPAAYDPDCMLVFLNSIPIPAYTDIRICMQEFDHAGGIWPATWPDSWGPVQCTNWASSGASWMPWVSEPDLYNPDGFRILVEARGFSNYSIANMRLGVQSADAGGFSSGCGPYYSTDLYTPYISQGGGWTTNVNAAPHGSPQDINCARLYLEPHWIYNPLPDLTASQTNYIAAYTGVPTNFSYTINNASAGATSAGVRSRLYFDYQANGYGVGPYDFAVTTDGAALGAYGSRVVTVSATLPVSGTWNAIPIVDPDAQMSESNEGNNYPAWDSFTVAAPPSPTVTLQAQNATTGGSWSGSDLSISAEDQVQMQWSSTNASSCSKTFTSGTAVSGGPVEVTEPFAGTYTDYTITCTGLTGTTPASDTLRVTAASALPTLTVNDEDKLVRRGDTVEFTWDLNGNDPAGCSFGGPGAPASVAGADNPFSVAIQGASTYTLTCAGGTAEVDMQILPEIFES